MINVPVPPYTRGPAIRALIEENWMARLDAFRPQMIFVSAGFDAHRDDELGQLGLVEADYTWITERIKAVADKHAQRPHRLVPGRRLQPGRARAQRRRAPARPRREGLNRAPTARVGEPP